jgi:hypothetical protein
MTGIFAPVTNIITDTSALVGALVPINIILVFCCLAGTGFAVWKFRRQPEKPEKPVEKPAKSVIEQLRASVDVDDPPPLKIRVPVKVKN